MPVRAKATIDDLMLVDGKAELVNGELVHMPPVGRAPTVAAAEIFVSLYAAVKRGLPGIATPDNAGFSVSLQHRESFSPDAAYYEGPRTGMRFFQGAPRFAAEVRSMGDYGPAADREIAAKRDDYFAAGTLVVWDVDLLSDDVVRVYRVSDPGNPTIYRRGQIAEAEPAVPGWSMPVDDLFEKE